MRNTTTLALALVFSMLFAVANCAWAVPLTLTGSTATFEQGAFVITKTVDGILTGTDGWAISGGLGSNQFAVYQTSTVPFSEGGTQLTITHTQARGDTHLLGNFRYWVTTDPSPTTISGASWTQLVPDSISTASGATFLIQPDNRMVWDVSQGVPTGTELNDIYTILSTIPGSIASLGVTGFRLETISDGSLMSLTNVVGPGLVLNNGNFVLTEVQMSAVAAPVPEPSTAMLLGLGAIGLVRHTRRRRRKA